MCNLYPSSLLSARLEVPPKWVTFNRLSGFRQPGDDQKRFEEIARVPVFCIEVNVARRFYQFTGATRLGSGSHS